MRHLISICVLCWASTAMAQDMAINFEDSSGVELRGGAKVDDTGEVIAFGARAYDEPQAWMPTWTNGSWDGLTLTVDGFGCIGSHFEIVNCRPINPWYQPMSFVSTADGITQWQVDGQPWRQWNVTTHDVRPVPEPSAFLLGLFGLIALGVCSARQTPQQTKERILKCNYHSMIYES